MRCKSLVFSLLVAICGVLAAQNGNDDFNFYYGSWDVKNKRLMEDGSWAEFPARVTSTKTLNGHGNTDAFEATINGKPYAGMSVRIYDAITETWQIQWYDTDKLFLNPKPSVGKFENGEGKFYKTIKTPDGHDVRVRFHWSDITHSSFRWEASWSIDGRIWNPTWIMHFKRAN